MKLWNNIAALQIAAVISTLILTIGVVIEYWAKLKLLALLILKWLLRRSTPFERCAFKKLSLHTIGPILVVLGIAGEVVFEGRDFVLEDEQEDQSQQTIESLKATVSENEKGAAQLRKDAEDERLARVKIEATVAWRELSPSEQKEVCAVLSPYAGTTSFVAYVDAEAGNFADEIVKSFRCAHWSTSGPAWQLIQTLDAPLPTGVIVASTQDKGSVSAAHLFCTKLTKFGFDCANSPDFLVGTPSRVEIRVDHRPKGQQGELKLEAEQEANRNSGNNAK